MDRLEWVKPMRSKPHLMHVQIQHQDSVHILPVQQHLSSDCQVIQDAEAGAEGREGMVGASRCVAGQAML